jgi:hypothetical protein
VENAKLYIFGPLASSAEVMIFWAWEMDGRENGGRMGGWERGKIYRREGKGKIHWGTLWEFIQEKNGQNFGV